MRSCHLVALHWPTVALEPATVSETLQVVALVPSAIASTEISANITADNIGALPVGRGIFQISELTPGLTNNASNTGQLTINGGVGYDNVFLIDGVDVNDNIFGTAHDLFIEDAIDETQVLTSGISAEYGRFSGGVVNTITKSGSNQFSGSFRTNLYKPDWTEPTPFEKMNGQDCSGDLSDNTTYETILGGPLVLDRFVVLLRQSCRACRGRPDVRRHRSRLRAHDQQRPQPAQAHRNARVGARP